ncbi:PilZ domain-containing protein [Velocimicrobium porci]|nr:PilZ domain-containing protein [Velocimicrobium porci]
MNNGYERRKYRRLPLNLTLGVSKLYKQDYIELNDINVDLEVVDISKAGIGFRTQKELPVDYYFDGRIELVDNDFFYAVVKIIRRQKLEDQNYIYGAKFVGLAPFLADKVDIYGRKIDEN